MSRNFSRYSVPLVKSKIFEIVLEMHIEDKLVMADN